MKIEKLHFGFEVKDCNMTTAEAERVRDLIFEGRFVLIRNPGGVEPARLVDFYRGIGVVATQPEAVHGSGVGGQQEIVRVYEEGMFAGLPDGSLEWHNCGLNMRNYDQIVAMYMHIAANEGGSTGFTDARGAYNSFSEEEKAEFDDMICINHYFEQENPDPEAHMKTHVSAHRNFYESAQIFVNADGERHIAKQIPEQQLVCEHPYDKKKGFYFPWMAIHSIKGLGRIKSYRLIKKLTAHCLQSQYVYFHKWQQGDLILNDQVHSLHCRTPYRGARELWRSSMICDV